MVFLVCLALAGMFWYMVALGEEYERDFDLRLQLKNVPENVVITTDVPQKIRVTLKDKGGRLLSYRYGGGLPMVNVDFRNYDQNSGHVKLRLADISKLLLPRLMPSTKIAAINPAPVEYFYNYGLHATLPVVFNATLEAEKFYSVSSVRFKPDSVTVYATQEVLDTMTAVYTQNILIDGINKRTVRRIPFVEVLGAKFEPQNVLMTADVDQITEKTVEVPVKWVNFPATKALRTFPSRVKITFQVGMSMYKRITKDDFVVVVNYDDVLKSEGGKLHLSLKSLPAGVSHVRLNPENIDYLVEDVNEEN